MSPIEYVEWTCDECDAWYQHENLAIMKNGKILCEECALKKRDQIFMWIEPEQLIPAIQRYEPEEEIPEDDEPDMRTVLEEIESEEEIPEPDAIDRAREEQLDRKC